MSSPLCVNFANPEARDEGATSLEAGERDDGACIGDVALESKPVAALPLSLLLSVAAAAAAEGGLRMLASGAMSMSYTRVDRKAEGTEGRREVTEHTLVELKVRAFS